jgi:PTH1 family peptidyl-tRNA hydrolase
VAWLQKLPQVSDAKPFYSTGLSKTVLLVGLGNPGKEYENTRHNIGFHSLDYFVAQADEMDSWVLKKNLKCHISSGRIGDNRVLAIKPTTFMNLSGESVQATAQFYKINLEYFGQIRLRLGGTSAGHNGIKSISNLIGENYNRVRIGIGPKQPSDTNSEDYVLQKFNKDEQSQMGNLDKELSAILSEYIYGNQALNETRSFII